MKLQVLLERSVVELPDWTDTTFKDSCRLLRRGDYICNIISVIFVPLNLLTESSRQGS